MHKAQVLRDFLPTKITLWTNASLLDTFCRNIWHAKQGKALEVARLWRRGNGRACPRGASRGPTRRPDWLRPGAQPPCKERHVALRRLLKMAARDHGAASRPPSPPAFFVGGGFVVFVCVCVFINLAGLSRNRFLTTCFSGSISQFGIHSGSVKSLTVFQGKY